MIGMAHCRGNRGRGAKRHTVNGHPRVGARGFFMAYCRLISYVEALRVAVGEIAGAYDEVIIVDAVGVSSGAAVEIKFGEGFADSRGAVKDSDRKSTRL